MNLEVGHKAPDFTLPRDGGGTVTLSDYLGKKVVVYFYPGDYTPGCTIEACSFRDHQAEFDSDDVVIIGISRDPVEKHDNFKEKYHLGFILASDPDSVVAHSYGVIDDKPLFGIKLLEVERSTFLVDEKGYIEKVWRNIFALGHVKKVLNELHAK